MKQTYETYISAWTRPALPGLRKLHDTGYHLILPLNPPYTLLSSQTTAHTETCSPSVSGSIEDTHKAGVKQEMQLPFCWWCLMPLNSPVMICLRGWGQNTFALGELKNTDSTTVVVNNESVQYTNSCRVVILCHSLFLDFHPVKYNNFRKPKVHESLLKGWSRISKSGSFNNVTKELSYK